MRLSEEDLAVIGPELEKLGVPIENARRLVEIIATWAAHQQHCSKQKVTQSKALLAARHILSGCSAKAAAKKVGVSVRALRCVIRGYKAKSSTLWTIPPAIVVEASRLITNNKAAPHRRVVTERQIQRAARLVIVGSSIAKASAKVHTNASNISRYFRVPHACQYLSTETRNLCGEAFAVLQNRDCNNWGSADRIALLNVPGVVRAMRLVEEGYQRKEAAAICRISYLVLNRYIQGVQLKRLSADERALQARVKALCTKRKKTKCQTKSK